MTLATLTLISVGGYQFYQTVLERNDLRTKTTQDAAKIDLLQEKYKEKKAIETNLMRKNMLLQGQIAKVTVERDQIKETTEAQIAARTAELEKIKADLGNKIHLLEKQHAQLESEWDQLRNQHKEALSELKNKTNELDDLVSAHKVTEGLLARTERSLDRCATHNTQLSIITEELIQNYSETGVVGSLAIAEPFTQLKQVEMERIVQEYLDRIEKHQFEKRNQDGS